jgi:hypothetical protein
MITFDSFIRSIHAAILSANDALVDKNLEVLERFFEATEGKEPLSEENVPGADSDQARRPDGLRPKMTTIQYPHKTPSGVVMSDVRVPLITLVPLSMTQISEVKLRTELEIQVKDEGLLVSFPTPQSGTSDDQEDESLASSRPVATLEITLTPHYGTEGLRKIVEGYEKALRAQIPH